MARVKNPLPDLTDAEILRAAARAVRLPSPASHPPFRAALAARLYQIARRVPLWTNNKEIGR